MENENNNNITEDSWEQEIAKAREEVNEPISIEQIEQPIDESLAFDEVDIPVVEAIEEKKVIKKEIPDVSDFISSTTISGIDLQNLLNTDLNLSNEELTEKLKDSNEHITKLARIFYEYTNQQKLEQRNLEKKKDVLKLSEEVIPDKISTGATFDNNKVLSGEEAKVNIMARIHGIKKIYLVHSGFYIVIRKPDTSELREILRYIDEEEKEIGKILGAHFYTVDDLFFKQKVCEILDHLVVDSNLKNWREKGTLIKAISINDFDIIIHGIVSLMFRNGVKHEIVCPDIECKYVEKIELDLNKTKLIDIEKISQEALSILLSMNNFDVKTYKTYQKYLNLNREVKIKDNIFMYLKVPSISTYLKFGNDFIAKMIKSLYSNNKPSGEEILEYRVINFYKMFLPWIDKVVFYKEDGSIDFETRDPEAILKLLDKDVWEDSENITEFTSFFNDTVLVHYGFLGQRCPSCNKEPNPQTNGFIPLDIRSFFFNLSVYQIRKDLSI